MTQQIRKLSILDNEYKLIGNDDKILAFSDIESFIICLNLNYDLTYYYRELINNDLKALDLFPNYEVKVKQVIEDKPEQIDDLICTYIEYLIYTSYKDEYKYLLKILIREEEVAVSKLSKNYDLKYFNYTDAIDGNIGRNGEVTKIIYTSALRFHALTNDILILGLYYQGEKDKILGLTECRQIEYNYLIKVAKESLITQMLYDINNVR